jgi:hypothetical protein
MTRSQNPRYQGEDATPSEPAITSYFGFDQLGPSYAHHQAREDHTLYELETSAGARWGPDNFDHYHLQDYEETISGIQRGHMSFSVRGIHDSFHGLFPYHAPQDYYHPTPQHHHQPPQHYHHPPPPMGYDKPDFYKNIDNSLMSLEAGQEEIRNTLHQQVEWQQQTTHRFDELQQYERQQQANFEYLFSTMGFEYPPPSPP